MFTIRAAQLHELSHVAFEAMAVAHVTRYFPRHVSALGAEETRRAVRAARAAAAALGFPGERELAHFIDLTFMFGPDFQSKPMHTWAAGILADRTIADPRSRMARLYEAALNHLRQLAAAPGAQPGV